MMTRLTRFRRRGVSLPEVVTVSAVFVTILGGMVSMGVGSATQYSSDSSKMLADADASMALQSLTRDVRNGIRATVGTGGTQLTVVLPAVNTQGDFDRYKDGVSVRYYLDTNRKRLCRQLGTGTPKVLGDNVTGLQFAQSGTQIGVTLTARQQVGSKAKQTVLKSTISLRNQLAQ